MNLEFVAIGILGLFVGFRSRRFPIKTVLLITLVPTAYFFWSNDGLYSSGLSWTAFIIVPTYFGVTFIGAAIGIFLQPTSDDDKN